MIKGLLIAWACLLGLVVFVLAAIWIKEKFTVREDDSDDCVLREEVGDKFIEHFLEQDKTR